MDDSLERCRDHFERCDRATHDFARRTGLACPFACGACCLSPAVETSAAEMRPMAVALADSGRAGAVLARLDASRAVGDGRCVLYEPDEADPRRGRCGAYPERPLVCRLFGFSARRDRLGRPELIACSVMRSADPGAVERAQREVRDGGAVPLMADRVRALAAEDPGAARLLPIDDALRAALESELLARRLAGRDQDEPNPEDRRPGPRRTPRPRRPPRAA